MAGVNRASIVVLFLKFVVAFVYLVNGINIDFEIYSGKRF